MLPPSVLVFPEPAELLLPRVVPAAGPVKVVVVFVVVAAELVAVETVMAEVFLEVEEVAEQPVEN